jgi:hypothetical protein
MMLKRMLWLLIGATMLAVFAGSSAAASINIMSDAQVGLAPGDSLTFAVTSSYAADAAGGSGYPGEIAMVLSGLPSSGATALVPGTSGVYTPGVLFSGTLESPDGSVSIPLFDANAARLGLPAGDLLLASGNVSGGAYSGPASLLEAAVTLSSPEAAALLASGEFVIMLQDVSGSVTFGYPGASITSAFSSSLISPDGTLSVGGRLMGASLTDTPEPGTIGLLLIGLAVVSGRLMRRGRGTR